MLNDSEPSSPNSPHDNSSGIAIHDKLKKLHKWREDMFEKFQNQQYENALSSYQHSNEIQKQLEQHLKNLKNSEPVEKTSTVFPESCNASPLPSINHLDSNDSVHEHSITGHLQGCFDDSPHSSYSVNPDKVSSVGDKMPNFSDLRISQFRTKNETEKQPVKDAITDAPSIKAKRPFLKKGTGLLRFMPNSATSRQVPKSATSSQVPKSATSSQVPKNKVIPKSVNLQKETKKLPQNSLKLKSAIRKTDAPVERNRHIRFDIPLLDNEEEDESLSEKMFPVSKSTEFEYELENNHNPVLTGVFESNNSEKSEEREILKKLEEKELAEFERLESHTQNSSFSSDSSFVQSVIHGKSIKTPCPPVGMDTKKLSSEHVIKMVKDLSPTTNFSGNIDFNIHKAEIGARMKFLTDEINLKLNPKIQTLQEEIASQRQENLDNWNSGNSVEDSNKPVLEYECNAVNGTAESPDEAIDFHDSLSPNQEDESMSDNEDNTITESLDNTYENEMSSNLLHEKLLQMHKEFEKYQKLNSSLIAKCKERDDHIKKLQKESDDFKKYKEVEEGKLKAKIEEAQRQIKRQKETFKRYQKCEYNPTRKEREELNSLRQEVQTLQEQLKRQKIKYANDSRKWKIRLDAAESERDGLKLKNIELEEQCEDLLSALKSRMKKMPEEKQSSCVSGHNSQENIIRDIPMTKDAETSTHANEFEKEDINCINNQNEITPSKISQTEKRKTDTHFNLVPEYNEKNFDIPSINVINKAQDHCTDKHYPTQHNETHNVSLISVSAECELKEMHYRDRIEKKHISGETEINFNNGTRKIISADKKLVKFIFHNGDVKEIYDDKREIYKYVNGVVEKIFPDGLKITEYPNGQTQHHYPDGQKEARFPDGSVRTLFNDGSEEIHSIDGTVKRTDSDGTKITEFANGHKIIITSTYKRREFPDGSVKLIFNSGKKETRYPDGRIKIKDKDGNLILDTKYLISKGQDS